MARAALLTITSSRHLLASIYHRNQDKTVFEFKQEEHSSIHHYITYSIVTAEPALSFSSVYSTIRVYPVTSGPHEDKTFIEWSATFSGDADASAIQVRRYSIIPVPLPNQTEAECSVAVCART